MKISAALSRELSNLPKQATVMVIGEVDTGKSTLLALLARWFRSQSQHVAIVDADVGQADIGPPGFVSYGFVEHDIESLQSVRRQDSYLVGSTSPYNRGLNVVAGVQACVRDARCQGSDVTLVDTTGLVKGISGIQLKCAKAEAIKPDLIIALNTPGIEPLTRCLKQLGFRVSRFLPIPGARIRTAQERKHLRVSRWNSYLGGNPHKMEIDPAEVKVLRWWGESRPVDTEQVPNGTVVAIPDPNRPGFHIPCVWTVTEGEEAGSRLSLLVPEPPEVQPGVVWVSGYKLGLEGNTVVSA